MTSDLSCTDAGADADVNSKDLKKDSGKINIKDIVWPGGALKPPEGIPEKRFVRVTFLEEDPYVMLGPPTTCAANKGIICQACSQNQTKRMSIPWISLKLHCAMPLES